MRCREQCADLLPQLRHGALHLIDDNVVNLILGEIDRRLEVRDEPEALLPHGVDLPREMTREMPLRHAQRAIRARAHDLHDRLRLREVEASGEERPLRELAALREPRARGEHEREHAAHDDAAAVARELDDILARIGVRRAHDEREHLVDGRAVRCDDMTVEHALRACVREPLARDRTEHPVRDRERARTADAQHADARFPGRRRDGSNRIRLHIPHPFPPPGERPLPGDTKKGRSSMETALPKQSCFIPLRARGPSRAGPDGGGVSARSRRSGTARHHRCTCSRGNCPAAPCG